MDRHKLKASYDLAVQEASRSLLASDSHLLTLSGKDVRRNPRFDSAVEPRLWETLRHHSMVVSETPVRVREMSGEIEPVRSASKRHEASLSLMVHHVTEAIARTVSDVVVHCYWLQLVNGRPLGLIDYDFVEESNLDLRLPIWSGSKDLENMPWYIPDFESLSYTYRSYKSQCERCGVKCPEIEMRNICTTVSRNRIDRQADSSQALAKEIPWLIMPIERALGEIST
jgi:hypothetical protein